MTIPGLKKNKKQWLMEFNSCICMYTKGVLFKQHTAISFLYFNVRLTRRARIGPKK